MNGTPKTNLRWALPGAAFLVLVVTSTVLAGPLIGKPPPHAAEVTFLEGKAHRTAHGAGVEEKLKVLDAIAQGDLISTEQLSRLELRLEDKSIIRLGPSSQIALNEAQFGAAAGGGDDTRKLTVKLFFGNLWAKVTTMIAGDQRFAIETENAVAGVRGTTFQVDAKADKSVRVRVLDGAVLCTKPVDSSAKSPAGTLRHEVNGPTEVPRKTWEKLLGAQMQLEVSAAGKAGEPTAIDPAAMAADPWVKWNQERDAK